MHDDIMDAAPLRRGQETVHIKWDENAAILSGDAMYTLAHIALAQLPAEGLPKALKLFQPDGARGVFGPAKRHGV